MSKPSHLFRNGLIACAVLVATGAFIYLNAPADSHLASPAVASSDTTPPLPSDAQVNRPAERSAPVPPVSTTLPPVDPVDPAEYATELPKDQLFAPLPEAREHFAKKVPFGVDDRQYLEFNRAALANLDVGSEMSMQIPGSGKALRIKIDEVQVHPNGDKSWTGEVLDTNGQTSPVVFTQGVDSSFGSISTPDGVYSLEAEGKLAWIADVNALRRYQDYSKSDVLIPNPADADPLPSQP